MNGKSRKRKKPYSYAVKMDGELEKPLKSIADKERRTVNDEIVVAIENHVKKFFPDYGTK